MSAQKRPDDEVIKVTIRISKGMYRNVEQIRARRGAKVTQVDLWREAMRKFLNDEADIIGSRAHFQRSLQERLEKFTDDLIARIPEDSAAIVNANTDAMGMTLQDELTAVRRLLEALLLLEAAQWARVGKDSSDLEAVRKLLQQAVTAADQGRFGLNKLYRNNK